MSCMKATHPTWDAADQALRRIRARALRSARDHHGLPIRAYRCSTCSGWHLTSSPERLKTTPHRKAA
jgi:hypothetical protein